VLSNKLALVLSSAGLLVATLTLTASCQAQAKAKKTARVASARGHYLVPPPPPYQPSLLPELAYSRPVYSTNEEVASSQTKASQPYSKYIYVRNSSDAPTMVPQNRYVSSWNQ